MQLKLLSIAVGTVFAFTASANGLQEDRSWKFDSAIDKQYMLNAETTRLKLKNGGFTQVFNVQADGASTVYVGNNTAIGEQTSLTNIANMSQVNQDIDGQGHVVGEVIVGQDLSDSQQTNDLDDDSTNTTNNNDGV